MPCVLPVALIQTVQAMAFAPKQVDGIDDPDVAIIDYPFEHPWQVSRRNAVNRSHQINDSRRIIIQSENRELSVRRRCAFPEFSSRRSLNVFPCAVINPNITVF